MADKENRHPGRAERPDTDGCPSCQSTKITGTGRLCECGGCGVALFKQKRRSAGLFGAERFYYIVRERQGVDDIAGSVKTGPHVIETEG